MSGNTTELPLPDAVYIAMGMCLSILWFTAVFGNVLVLYVIHKKRAKGKFYNHLIISIAVCHLLEAMIDFPLMAVSSFYKEWLFGDTMCHVAGYTMFALSLVNVDTQIGITIFRYILVCHPKLQYLMNSRVAWVVTAVSWTHGLVWASLPLVGWGRYDLEPYLVICSVDTQDSSALGVLYRVLSVAAYFVLPVIILVFCYASLMTTSERLSMCPQRHSASMRIEELLWRHKVDTERNVNKMCLAMMAALMLCLAPLAVVTIMSVAGVKVPVAVTALANVLHNISCTSNPIIYTVMSVRFRDGLRGAFCCGAYQRQNRDIDVEMARRRRGSRGSLWSLDGVSVRKYRGDLTQEGVFIGRHQLFLEIHSSVF